MRGCALAASLLELFWSNPGIQKAIAMRYWGCFVVAAVVLAGAWGQEPRLSAAPLLAPPLPNLPGTDASLDNQEELASFEPAQPRGESETDKVEALALFSAGRAQEQQGNLAAALRSYQRALRLDPAARSVLQEIVQLAFGLGRSEEAVRYALKSATLDPTDPVLLQRLAVHLTSRGELADAKRLYEQAAQLLGDVKTPARVVLAAELGEIYLAEGEVERAADSLALLFDALQFPEKYQLESRLRNRLLGDEAGQTHTQIGLALLGAGRLDEAARAFEVADQHAPDPGVLAFRQAQIAAKRDQPETALAALATCFEDHEASLGTGPYALLAELLEKQGSGETLMKRLEDLRAVDPENLPLRLFIAQRQQTAGQLDTAGTLYRGLLADHPSTESLAALVEIDQQQQHYDDLLTTLGVCVAEGGDLTPLGDAGEALSADSAAVDGLVAAARARLAADPQQPLSSDQRLAVALVALEAKRAGEANEFFEAALAEKRDDAALVYLRWGFGLLRIEDYAEAARVFQLAIDRQAAPSEAPDFKFHLASSLAMLGQTDAALAAADDSLKLAEERPDEFGDKLFRMYPRRAWILYHAKRYDEATEAYQAVVSRLENVHTSTEARDAVRESRFALSNICVLTGNLAAGEEWLEQVLDEYPDDVAASNDLGYLWADQGRHLARAMRMIESAVAAQPDNEAYRDSLGWAYFRLGRFEDAVRELTIAAQAADTAGDVDGVILDHLADAHAKLNHWDQARDAWTRAAAAFETAGDTAKRDATQAKLSAIPAAP